MTRFPCALLLFALALAGCGDNKSQMPKEIGPQPTGNPGPLLGGPGKGKLSVTK